MCRSCGGRRRAAQAVSVVGAIDRAREVEHPAGAAARRWYEVARIVCGAWQGTTVNVSRTTVAAPVAGHAQIRFDRIQCELCGFLHAGDRFIDRERLAALIVDLQRTDNKERADRQRDHHFDQRQAILVAAYLD